VPEAPGYVFPKELRNREKLEILPSPSSYTPIPVQNRAPVTVFPLGIRHASYRNDMNRPGPGQYDLPPAFAV
jgi:hypothetical protein